MTDRRRRPVVEQARRAVDAGVDLIHVRERDLEARALAALVDSVLAEARGSSTLVVVNDRLDIALACEADGVHLRADSISPEQARTIAPAGFAVGRSVHHVDEAKRVARDASYLVAGTVFPTSSKAAASWLGVDGLAAIVRAVPTPVLAIGGVSIERVAAIAASGAAGIAAIGLFAEREGSLRTLVDEVRARFDSAKSGS